MDTDYDFSLEPVTCSDREADSLGEVGEPEVIMELDEGPEIKEENYEDESVTTVLSSIPIVFTTRLDDMLIFNQNNDSMTLKDITDNILKESMPKYYTQKPINKPSSKKSYQALTGKIKNMNLKAECESSVSNKTNSINRTDVKEAELAYDVKNRNAKLLKMCKPMRVVLKKLVFSNDEEAAPLYKKKKLETDNKFINLYVLQDYSINKTDIYCIENGIITENYTLNNISDEALISYISAYKNREVNPRKVSFCCWHQREAFIVSLNPSDFNSNAKEFMKTPHRCPFDKCTCCCRSLNEIKDDEIVSHTIISEKNNLTEISAEDMEINDLEKEIAETFHEIKQNSVEYGYKYDWLEKLNETKENDTLVGKALKYTRPVSKLTKGESNKSKFTNYSTKFIHQFNAADINRVETFELQKEGNLVAYLNQDMSSKITPEVYQEGLSNYNEAFLLGHTCCWYGREKNISRLFIDTPNLARFMKLSHTCLPNNCKCCCKPQKPTSLLKNTLILNRKIHVHKELKNDKQQNKNTVKSHLNFRGTKINTDTTANSCATKTNKSITPKLDDTITNKDTLTNSRGTKTNENPAITIRASVLTNSAEEPINRSSQDKIILESRTTRPNLKRKINNNKTINPSIQSQNKAMVTLPTNILEINSNQTNNQFQQNAIVLPIDNSAQDLAVGSMITTILDRFKNVRLTINEDGKVAAALNAPADTLNTAELKVLANILSHAQKQVKALGLGPGSSLNTNDIQKSVDTSLNFSNHNQNQTKPIVSSTKITPAKHSAPKVVNICPKPEHFDKPTIVDKLSNISQEHTKSLMKSYFSYIECKKNQAVNTAEISNRNLISSVSVNTLKNENDVGDLPKISTVIGSTEKNMNDVEGLPKILKVTGSAVNSINDSGNIPKISSVFSLQDVKNTGTQKECLKSSKSSGSIVAHNSKTNNSEPPPPKIRVVDPAKLGITSTKMVEPVVNDKTQFRILNENLMDAELNTNSDQEKLMPNAVEVGTIPMGYIGPEIQSLPIISNVMGNAVIPQTISSYTGSQSNILVVNPLQSSHCIPDQNILTNPCNIQFVTPAMNTNTIAQNIHVMPQNTSATTVFHISNLDRMSIAEPRLLNAEPVPRRRINPPPLVRVAPKPAPDRR